MIWPFKKTIKFQTLVHKKRINIVLNMDIAFAQVKINNKKIIIQIKPYTIEINTCDLNNALTSDYKNLNDLNDSTFLKNRHFENLQTISKKIQFTEDVCKSRLPVIGDEKVICPNHTQQHAIFAMPYKDKDIFIIKLNIIGTIFKFSNKSIFLKKINEINR